MAEIRQESKNKEIRNLLFVIFSGILGAFAVALGMLYYYNPTGSYLAGNVLLSPESTQVIRFNDVNPKTGATSKFLFDQVEFTYFDAKLKQWKNLNVDQDKYVKLYQAISSDRSLDATDEIKILFNKDPSKLILKIRSDTNVAANAITKPFIEVNFANDGDYYRIELHEENSLDTWAYFYHPGIYKETFNIIIPAIP